VRVVLSDLDDTLFDHSHATKASLAALAGEIPELTCWPIEELDERHRVLLDRLHVEVLQGRRSIDDARRERFGTLVRDAGGVCSADRADDVARRYRENYERAWQVVPGALALAAAIRTAGLRLVIVTNNIVSEQRLKMDRCKLSPHVDLLLTSQEAGYLKPDPRIFQLALARIGVNAAEAVMLGDAWSTDIEGARAAAVRAVWLNRRAVASPDRSIAEIRSLEPTADVMKTLTRTSGRP
jgi:putative hydrolase of the HAD superfamily